MSCTESFRFVEYPRVRVGLVHLDRKRPWPSCQNPETGNEWSADMKSRMIGILESLDFVDLFRTDEKVRVNDDRSVNFCSQEHGKIFIIFQVSLLSKNNKFGL